MVFSVFQIITFLLCNSFQHIKLIQFCCGCNLIITCWQGHISINWIGDGIQNCCNYCNFLANCRVGGEYFTSAKWKIVFHQKLFYGGFRHFVLYLWCFLPTKYLLYFFVYHFRLWMSECSLTGISRSRQKLRVEESSQLPLCSRCHVTSIVLYKLEYSPFRPIIKVGWVTSNWKRNALLCFFVTCALLRNTPWNKHF